MDINKSLTGIKSFVEEMDSQFGDSNKKLKIYKHLLDKTSDSKDADKKQLNVFKEFCEKNKEAISERDVTKLVSNITYSDNVYINMRDIFSMADRSTSNCIWDHLLYISASIDPSGKAREMLKKQLANGTIGDNETDFLTDIIDKVEKHVDPDATPMQAISSIMQSGVFTDLISGMNNGVSNGSLDMGKLMGAVQGMMGNMDGDNKQMGDMMKMVSGMMGGASNGEGVPDISKLLENIQDKK